MIGRGIRLTLVGLLAVAAAEAVARLAFDFPLHQADAEQGYWIRPSQHGAYLFAHDWAFNAEGLGVAEEFRPSRQLDVLLVGDSLVYGGNRLRQADKLGPLLEARTGWQVWPAGAGGWSLQNELVFLHRRPELVAGADVIVFVSDSDDFTAPAEWRSRYTHPVAPPTLYLPYLFGRYVTTPPPAARSPYPVKPRDVPRDWAEFVRSAGKPVFVIAYSASWETGKGCDWVPEVYRRAGNWVCYDPMRELGPAGFYDEIHPTVLGNKALADRIAATIERAGVSAP